MAKETKDYTVKEVVEALINAEAEGKQAWFEARRRFPAIESTEAMDIVLILVGDKPAFVLEKKLRDAFYSEGEAKTESKPEKPKKKGAEKIAKASKPEKPEKPAKPEKEKAEEPKAEKAEGKKKPAADDIDALIAEIDGEGVTGEDDPSADDPDDDDD